MGQPRTRHEFGLGIYHSGELKRESAEAKAERIIREAIKRLSWTESELETRAKSDPAKLALAARVRWETTLTLPCSGIDCSPTASRIES